MNNFLYICALNQFRLPMWIMIIYYLLLYILVILVNYFKLKKDDDSTPEGPGQFKLKEVFFISGEIIYGAGGVFIVIIQDNLTWAPIIVVALMLILIGSTNISATSEKFTTNQKLLVHISIIAIVVLSTFFTFYNQERIQQLSQKKINIPTVFNYRVSIPYADKSLDKSFSHDKILDKYFSYIVSVKDSTKHGAINQARILFWQDSTIQPLNNKKNINKSELLKIEEKEIIVEKNKYYDPSSVE